MKKFAIYDMDRTITRSGTYTAFLIFAALRLNPIRLLLFPLLLVCLAGYPLGLLQRKTIKEIGFGLIIGRRIASDRLDPIARAFAERVCTTGLYVGAIPQIEADREDGRMLVMATASPDYYAKQIGGILGFNSIIATQQTRGEKDDYLNGITGENCYDAAKLARITAWMAKKGFDRNDAHIRFYSDHVSDAPTWNWCDDPKVVNPSRKARALAASKGWPILDFSSPTQP